MISTRRDRIILVTGVVVTGVVLALTPAARAQPATDTVAGQIKATEAQNRRIDAAMAAMKLARPLPRKKAVAKKTDDRPAQHRLIAEPAGSAASQPAPASDHAETAGKSFQVGPVTITPGGFLALDRLSR